MRETLRCGTPVVVLDDDDYAGQNGVVARDEYLGLLSRRPMVDVQLEGREKWDVEGFYVEQLEVAA